MCLEEEDNEMGVNEEFPPDFTEHVIRQCGN